MLQATDDERKLWRAFFLMRRQLDLTLERRLQGDASISTADFEILSALVDEPTKRLRAGRIAELIGWEKSRVSHQLNRMEQRKLVRREECGDDGRGVWVALTEAGAGAVLSASGDHSAVIREYFFDVLSADEKASLTVMSQRMLDTINSAPGSDEGAVAR